MITPEYLVGQEDDFIWIKGVTDSDLEAALGGTMVEGTNNYGRFVTSRETIDRLRDRTHIPEVYRVVWRGDGEAYNTTVLARVESPYSRIVATFFSFRDKLPELLIDFDRLFPKDTQKDKK